MKQIKVLFSLIILLTAFYSCKKEKVLIDTAAINEIIIVETVYADISEQIETHIYTAQDIIFGTHKTAKSQLKSSCATLSILPLDSVSWPKTITIDYGSSDCLGEDGRYRKGKIMINTTGRYNDSTTVLTVTFDNYYLNNDKIAGSVIITNRGINNQNFPLYTILVNNGSIETDEGIISWQSNTTKKWVNGLTTPYPLINDDTFIHAGKTQGTFTDGSAFNADIINLLVTNTYCPWIDSGTLEISKKEKVIGTLDFGDFTCDSLATITVDGVTSGVELK